MTIKKQSKKNQIIFLLPVLIVLTLTGCEKPSINFGNSFLDNSNTNIVIVDTLSVDLSTVFVDSFPTAGTATMLIGRYKDPYFGVISSGSFLQVHPPGSVPAISNQATYDSIALILRINKIFYGDTTQQQRYTVSQLESVIQLPATQSTFYNNSSFPFNPSPLGSTEAAINPTAFFTSQKANDSLKIRLSDSKGFELFNLFLNKSDTIRNLNTFLGYFKGLYIYPDDNSLGAIYGFKDSIIMRIYYHEPGVVLTNKFIDLAINDPSTQFNEVKFDRTGTPLANVNSLNYEVPSSATNNAAYVQSGTGLEVKIRFPYLWKLPQLPDYVSVLRAQLIIKPIAGTYSPALALPPQLILSQTNQNNLLGSPIIISGISGAQTQTGNLVVDYLYGVNTDYTYDITSYIKQQITLGADNNSKNGLMLVIPSPANNTSFNRAIIGDKFNQNNNKIVLKLYYVSFY